MTNPKDGVIERLRFVQSQGGGYYELAQDCIDLIEAMASVGIRQETEIARLRNDIQELTCGDPRRVKDALPPKSRLCTLRKTVEYFAHRFRKEGGASGETIAELTEAAAVLQALENAPEPNRGSQGAGETMPVAKPVRRSASLTHEPCEGLPHLDTCGLKYGGSSCTCGLTEESR